jgi:hypothetical protein
VAVGCQLASCGVTAVGRCLQCGRAFCMTHQAREGSPPIVKAYLDRCLDCIPVHEFPAARKLPYKRPEEMQAWIRGEARDRLSAKRYPMTDIYAVRHFDERKWYGGRQRSSKVVLVGPGWLLPPGVTWTMPGNRAYRTDDTTSYLTTALLAEDSPGLSLLLPCSDKVPEGVRGRMINEGWVLSSNQWSTVHSLIETMLGRP